MKIKISAIILKATFEKVMKIVIIKKLKTELKKKKLIF